MVDKHKRKFNDISKINEQQKNLNEKYKIN